MEFRQLLPEPGEFHLDRRLDELDLGSYAPADRPFTIVNFVAPADGHATFKNRSVKLGDDGDRAMFHGLREHADAVLAGTGTLEVENYGRILGKPERRERRERRGLSSEPLACVFTLSGAIPTEIPLFQTPEARIVVFAAPGSAAARTTYPAQVTVVELDPSELTLTTATRHLRNEFEIRMLLCEGGPTMFGALLREGLVDELWLTLTPQLTGGGNGPTISSGHELPELQELAPVWALERNGSLFLRYALRF